jgi:hypothetical protein
MILLLREEYKYTSGNQRLWKPVPRGERIRSPQLYFKPSLDLGNAKFIEVQAKFLDLKKLDGIS